MSPNDRPGSAGWGAPAAGCLAAIAVAVAAAFWVALSASASESAGVRATLIASLPVGAAGSWAVAAVLVRLAARDSGVLRWAAPLGCACLGGAALLLAAVLFFQVIFPAL